jgi:hypothetical protein
MLLGLLMLLLLTGLFALCAALVPFADGVIQPLGEQPGPAQRGAPRGDRS